MPTFHLNVFNDIDVGDDEGAEYRDIAAAKTAAIAGVRGLMAEHIVSGRAINLSHRIEIMNENGKVLVVIPFREVITFVDAPVTPD